MFSNHRSKGPKRKHSLDDQGGDSKRTRSGANTPLPQPGQVTASQPNTRDPSPSPSESASTLGVVNATRSMLNLSAPSTSAAPHMAPSNPTTSTRAHTSNTLPQVKKAGKKIWAGVKNSIGVLEKGSNLCPPLQSALADVIACLDAVHLTAENEDAYEELATEIKSVSETIAQYIGQLGPEGSNGTVARIAKSIVDEAAKINKHQNQGAVQQIFESGDVIEHYRRIEALFRQLQADMTLRSWQTTDSHFKMWLLDRLAPVSDAWYNSSYSTTIKRRGCTAETREQVQADLQNWVQDLSGAKVYWMNGMAGTGKTTIAYSLCEWLEENHLLGASFFCSRTSSACSNLNQIIPTIAYQVAHYSPAFRSELSKLLDNSPDAGKLNVVAQFEKLIKAPLLKVKGATSDEVAVVIDALDECADSYSVRLMLEVLLKDAASLPLKFFVASRPEPSIQSQMQSPGGYSPSVLRLHEIEQSIVEQDIKKYLEEALSPISPAPSAYQIEQLAKSAGKLFIYAATVVRYIFPEVGWGNSHSRFNAILANGICSSRAESGPIRYRKLDELYKIVLTAAFHNELEDSETDMMRLVISTVICAREPTSTGVLASLLGLEEQTVVSTLQPLQSVLHVSTDGIVSALHASFPDYILDDSRSKKFAWHCDEAWHNQYLAERCFESMKKCLKFNICGLKSSFRLDKDVPDLNQRVEEAINPALLYTCRYWGDHLRLCNPSEKLQATLSEFLSRRLLFWMEVLNLRGYIVECERIIRGVEVWLGVREIVGEGVVHAADARDFAARFTASACRQSTCHLYLSAVEFFRSASSVHEQFRNRLRGSIKVGGTLVESRGGMVLAQWVVGSGVYAVAFSPDGTRVVSGSSDNTIRVWDAQTAKLVAGPFEGHTGGVRSVAFSPDGTRVVSGSDDKTIRVWDARTAKLVAGPFEGHVGVVMSVAFSPDGTRVVSGSYDKTIRVWDAQTAKLVAGPFEGHTDAVWSVAFSPDGTRVVSGSDDNTIRVWDTRTAKLVAGPFEGHTSSIMSVAFSPDGTRVVSGSFDETIRVWDARTAKLVAGPFEGHTRAVTSVAFSLDGTRVVSGSFDGTIHVWDIQTAKLVAGPFEGHVGVVMSVAFSPDGTRVVSGSYDKTIRVWDAQTAKLVAGPFEGHTDAVWSVAFSPDGTRVVSGSRDKTIRVWDAQTAKLVAGPFEGHTDAVTSVAFSPDGTRVVSGSYDETIRVWNAQTAKLVAGPFEGHTSVVTSVAFSPDGTRVVSGSDDNTIRVWNAQTAKLVASPFEGHTGWGSSVAFSPDGTHIFHDPGDGSVRVLDLSGTPIPSESREYSLSQSTVVNHPDGQLVVSITSTVGEFDDVIQISRVTHHSDLSSIMMGTWDFNPDGWITCDGKLLFWVPPDLHKYFPYPPVFSKIYRHGSIAVEYSNLLLGERWTGCYIDQ